MTDIDVTSDAFLHDPYPTYARLRAERPVYWSDQRRAYLLTRYDDVRWAFRARELNCAHPFRASRQAFGGPTMLDMDGQAHRQLRTLLGPELSPTKVDEFTPRVIREVVRDAISRLAGSDHVDLMADLAARVPFAVMTRLMGLPQQDARWLERQLTPMIAFIDYPRNPLADAVNAREKLEAYFDQLVADLDQHNAPVLRRLLTATPDGISDDRAEIKTPRSSSDDHNGRAHKNGNGSCARPDMPDRATILRTLMLLIAAGTETTIGAIGSTLYCLLTHPRYKALAGHDRDLLPSIVTESLRWEAPLHSTLRFAAQDFERHGVLVKRGSPIELCIASAGRDEAAYDNPDRWDPDRTQPELLAFGASGHSCLGRPLAVREVEVVIEELLSSFPNLCLSNEHSPTIVGRTFRRPNELWVTVPKNHKAVA